MYADDVVFCGEWSIANARNLRRLLRGFYLVSGLRINSKKSCVYGVGVEENEVEELSSAIHCSHGSFPFIHLGVPIATNMNLVKNWDPVVDKVKKRLSSWKSKCLSYGGRITLLKSVLSSLPLYYFSLFRAPVQVVEALERIRRKFFWGGTNDIDKLSWMAWDKVVSPPKFGGVGLGALRESNLSLLSKWWWRFKTNQNGLWRKVVWAIHGSSRGWYCIPVKLSLGGTWKQIASIPKLLGNYNMEPHKLIKASLKSGNDICFWLDWWIGDDILQNLFPLLYGLERNKCCLVSDRIRMDMQMTQLCWEWRRADFSAQELAQLAELQQLLSGVSISAGPDSWAATTDGSGCFSVCAVKKRMLEATHTVPAVVFEWCNWVPKKVGIVAWRALYDRLPTTDALLRRNIQVTNVSCCLCDTNYESVEHLFTGCPVALEIWPYVFSWCRVPNLFAFHVRDLLLYYKTAKTNDRARKAFYGVVLTTFWSLWKARNDLLHNQKPVVVRNVFEEIKIMSYLWITNRGKMTDMTWDSWGRFDTTKMG